MLERYVDIAAGDYPLRGGIVMLAGALFLIFVTIYELFPMAVGATPSFGPWLRSGHVIDLCLLPAAALIALIEGAHIAAFEASEDDHRERSIINYWAVNRLSGYITTVVLLGLLTWGIGSFGIRYDYTGFWYSFGPFIRLIVGPEWNGHEYSFLYFAILLAPCFLFISFQMRLCAKIALYITRLIHVAMYFLFPSHFMLEVA